MTMPISGPTNHAGGDLGGLGADDPAPSPAAAVQVSRADGLLGALGLFHVSANGQTQLMTQQEAEDFVRQGPSSLPSIAPGTVAFAAPIAHGAAGLAPTATQHAGTAMPPPAPASAPKTTAPPAQPAKAPAPPPATQRAAVQLVHDLLDLVEEVHTNGFGKIDALGSTSPRQRDLVAQIVRLGESASGAATCSKSDDRMQLFELGMHMIAERLGLQSEFAAAAGRGEATARARDAKQLIMWSDGSIGTRAQHEAALRRAEITRTLQTLANVEGGLGGALGAAIGGDDGSDFGAAIDGVVTAFGGTFEARSQVQAAVESARPPTDKPAISAPAETGAPSSPKSGTAKAPPAGAGPAPHPLPEGTVPAAQSTKTDAASATGASTAAPATKGTAPAPSTTPKSARAVMDPQQRIDAAKHLEGSEEAGLRERQWQATEGAKPATVTVKKPEHIPADVERALRDVMARTKSDPDERASELHEMSRRKDLSPEVSRYIEQLAHKADEVAAPGAMAASRRAEGVHASDAQRHREALAQASTTVNDVLSQRGENYKAKTRLTPFDQVMGQQAFNARSRQGTIPVSPDHFYATSRIAQSKAMTEWMEVYANAPPALRDQMRAALRAIGDSPENLFTMRSDANEQWKGARRWNDLNPADGARYGYSVADVKRMQAMEARIEATIDAKIRQQAQEFARRLP